MNETAIETKPSFIEFRAQGRHYIIPTLRILELCISDVYTIRVSSFEKGSPYVDYVVSQSEFESVRKQLGVQEQL